jgi:hypothetical protein
MKSCLFQLIVFASFNSCVSEVNHTRDRNTLVNQIYDTNFSSCLLVSRLRLAAIIYLVELAGNIIVKTYPSFCARSSHEFGHEISSVPSVYPPKFSSKFFVTINTTHLILYFTLYIVADGSSLRLTQPI